MTRRLALLALITLALAVVAGWLVGRTTAAQASQSSAVAPQQQPASSDQKPGTWEYRILSSALHAVVKYSGIDNKGRPFTNPGPYLEEEFNKLAAQGFVVESFELTSSVDGGSGASFSGTSRFSFSGTSQVVVLLKRPKN